MQQVTIEDYTEL